MRSARPGKNHVDTQDARTTREEVSPTAEEFDLVVLGGGPGGYAAALYGASAGLSIAMVEEGRVGGTCLHRGCIPAKELLQTAEVLRTIRGAGEFGIGAGEPTLDLATTHARKQQVIDKLTSGLQALLKGRKVTVVPGRGTLAADGRSVLVNGDEIRGRAVVLATGSLPRTLPGFDFDGERILSSDHVLELDTPPGRVAVIGGGAIGCEFASYLVDVGSDVTLLEALPQILPGVDQQVAQTVARTFTKRGIKLQTGVNVRGVEQHDGALRLRFDAKQGEELLDVDRVVVSIGRRPRSEGVGLDEAGVKVDERGFVVVDGNMRTSVDGVFAVGDLVATPQLAHVAYMESIVVVKTVLGEQPAPVDYDKVPWGIYCHPEVAFCGLTEAEAKDRGHEVETSVHRWGGNSRALIMGETDGMVKIVSEKGGGPLLGVHIAGPWATELIHEGYLSVNWEATPADLGLLTHAHPTLSELFGESALALTGRRMH
jgi:dihydrolipoamide dehydrogenase